jgi:pimeloyl-ACP methyl ester carboxylesterase
VNEEAYRAAERECWNFYGVEPSERFIDVPDPAVRVRVQETGTGRPVLFVHGGPNAGTTWAPLVGQGPLRGYRCLIVDRPGCGLSGPIDYNAATFPETTAAVLAAVLDGLAIEQADVVASSIGGTWALWLARSHPSRVRRMVQMGCPALIEGMKLPPFMRVMATPGVGAVMGRMPPNPRAMKMILRQVGHADSIARGLIPQVVFDWSLSLSRDTDTMTNEIRMIRTALTPRRVRPEVQVPDSLLAELDQPTLFVWGDNDPFGGLDVARRAVAAMPHAELHVVPKAGHLPWLDDPEGEALLVEQFFGAAG